MEIRVQDEMAGFLVRYFVSFLVHYCYDSFFFAFTSAFNNKHKMVKKIYLFFLNLDDLTNHLAP